MNYMESIESKLNQLKREPMDIGDTFDDSVMFVNAPQFGKGIVVGVKGPNTRADSLAVWFPSASCYRVFNRGDKVWNEIGHTKSLIEAGELLRGDQ